ncbi:hypothetical protein ANCCAN_18822 [Ancylostoma caninum]|uniref:Glycosyltransferase family 92 protein n=1 Tax=Ancylostoma caninum TaxID=29170 RepID=A0A368FX40_ANCCA|nr:hypothetical protein ANCCAN_18822 [Ancylostoma caninum]
MFALEMWKAQGVHRVLVYYHSSSQHVRKVLRHYQKEVRLPIVSTFRCSKAESCSGSRFKCR